MTKYTFRLPLAAEPEDYDFRDDQAAWSQAVTYAGELLKDIDGSLPTPTDWTLSVSDGDRLVAHIAITARRC